MITRSNEAESRLTRFIAYHFGYQKNLCNRSMQHQAYKKQEPTILYYISGL